MTEAERIVAGLDDLQAVAMLKRIHADIARSVARDQLVAAPEAERQAQALATVDRTAPLTPAHSVEASRRLLAAVAADAGTAPLVTHAWAAIQEDDSLMIETILVAGLIVNMTLFMATSRIRFRVGALQIDKGPATAELVKAVLDPIVELVRRVPAV